MAIIFRTLYMYTRDIAIKMPIVRDNQCRERDTTTESHLIYTYRDAIAYE